MGTAGNFLYRPDLGAKGASEFALFDAGLLAADTELKNCYDHRTLAHTFIGLTDVPATYVGETLKYVRVNAAETALEFVAPGASTPGGNDTEVQFNDGGALAGDTALVWNKTDNRLGIGATPATTFHMAGGHMVIGPAAAGAGNTGQLRFRELAATGTNHVGFKAPDAIAADIIWVLPNVDGTVGQTMVTDGSGVLSWATFVAGLSNPMTTRGDIIYYGATNPARLAIGTVGQVLTVVDVGSGILEPGWATGSGGGASAGAAYDIQLSDGAGGFTYKAGAGGTPAFGLMDYGVGSKNLFYCWQCDARFNPKLYVDGNLYIGWDVDNGELCFKGNMTGTPTGGIYHHFVNNVLFPLTSDIRYYLPYTAPTSIKQVLGLSSIGYSNQMEWVTMPPSDASYITTSSNATLTAERVLTGTANQITVTDNGSGVGTVVLSFPTTVIFTGNIVVPNTLSFQGKDNAGTARSLISMSNANHVNIAAGTCVRVQIGSGCSEANPVRMYIDSAERTITRKKLADVLVTDYVVIGN